LLPCICRYYFSLYLLHSPVMIDLYSLRLFIQQWTVVTTFSSGRKRRRKKDIEHCLSLSLSSPIYVYIKYFRVLFFFLFLYSIKMKRKEAQDSRPDVRLRSIDKRRADEEVFVCMCVCVYTLETNKKWHTTATTDASRCVSWSEKDIGHVSRSTNGSFKNWLLPIRRRETSWIGSIKL
jgi:hypothetical protein